MLFRGWVNPLSRGLGSEENFIREFSDGLNPFSRVLPFRKLPRNQRPSSRTIFTSSDIERRREMNGNFPSDDNQLYTLQRTTAGMSNPDPEKLPGSLIPFNVYFISMCSRNVTVIIMIKRPERFCRNRSFANSEGNEMLNSWNFRAYISASIYLQQIAIFPMNLPLFAFYSKIANFQLLSRCVYERYVSYKANAFPRDVHEL